MVRTIASTGSDRADRRVKRLYSSRAGERTADSDPPRL
ncbi:hypothetical protein J2S53_002457 [Actinopolyspora lacussalsi]|nr:hypothetical protein [Actinopolyspora lacussalsi]